MPRRRPRSIQAQDGSPHCLHTNSLRWVWVRIFDGRVGLSKFPGTNVPITSSTRLGFPGGSAVAKSKAEEFRENARRCEDAAAVVTDSCEKYTLLDLARQWRDLADQIQKYSLR